MSSAELGRAIIVQALIDACAPSDGGLPVIGGRGNSRRERDTARDWLTRHTPSLETICALGEVDADAIVSSARRLALLGWPTTALITLQAARASG